MKLHNLYKQNNTLFKMTNYVCNICNYKFSSAKPIPPKRCPYCSAEGSVKAEATASDLLKEVQDLVEKDRV